MLALTLIQPWASLIAIGAKKIETRGRPTHYRGPLAIHAGKKLDLFDPRGEWMHVAERALKMKSDLWKTELPRGQVIAIVNLVDVVPAAKLMRTLSARERALGTYARGRFGWVLEDVRAIVPVDVRGWQGGWEWDASLRYHFA